MRNTLLGGCVILVSADKLLCSDHTNTEYDKNKNVVLAYCDPAGTNVINGGNSRLIPATCTISGKQQCYLVTGAVDPNTGATSSFWSIECDCTDSYTFPDCSLSKVHHLNMIILDAELDEAVVEGWYTLMLLSQSYVVICVYFVICAEVDNETKNTNILEDLFLLNQWKNDFTTYGHVVN
eukprot:Blabericola_migrator_1__3802@NODE_2144_length_3210_cov_31_127267_g5_i1_p2_GENE_NODE_2144_length_3210_cov_31_127267_g5_i1NODE_2144_length_3210_cov_31_127267_g5_i1_p2_ORF_typecomplete_len180_score15_41_NODE_2144_length_3210_cov_31_127267_g5_i16461185